MNLEVWNGVVDGETVRILQTDTNDAIVERLNEEGTPFWEAADDELASHVYMQAFLLTCGQLAKF